MAIVFSFVGSSAAMRRVVELVAHAAESDAPVLVEGEPGSGKTRVAREIHTRSARSKGPFETIACEVLPEAVLAAELFGDGGALRTSSRGTVYVDEIASLSATSQVRLASTLASARIARIVLGTSRPSDRALRRDLFDRPGTIVIALPPLRDRREDVVPLVEGMLVRAAMARGVAPYVLSPDAAAALEAYDWPGNVRELDQAIARAVATSESGVIRRDSLPPEVAGAPRVTLPPDLASLQYRDVLAYSRDLLCREYLSAVLSSVQGNVTLAAERAGVERESLHRLLKRYGLRAEAFRPK